MTLGSDSAESMLFCSENSITIFDPTEEEEESEEISWVLGCRRATRGSSSGVLVIDSPLLSESYIQSLLGREEEHLPREGYAERLLQQPGGSDLVAARSAAIDWIWKVYEHYKLGPLTAVLSVNYIDRFLSVNGSALGEAWAMHILTVACLFVAAKMEETIVLNPLDVQVVDSEYMFEPKDVLKMEVMVLNTLSWRMQAVTTCSFIDYYLHKFSDSDDVVSKIVLSHSVQLILSVSKVAEFLVFRPSEIAASVALVALGKHGDSVLESVATCCKELRKERVLGCYQVIQDKIVMENIVTRSDGCSVFTQQPSPKRVLEVAACKSRQSEGTSVGAPIISDECSSTSKRRRICK